MLIEYMGRQTTVTPKYKAQVEAGLSRIEKLVNGAATAKVVLTTDKYRRIADVTVMQGDRSIVAACESAEMMTALRDALAKIEQQVVRQRKRAKAIARRSKSEFNGQAPEAAAS
jgi:putative sigma-54 modulation protein